MQAASFSFSHLWVRRLQLTFRLQATNRGYHSCVCCWYFCEHNPKVQCTCTGRVPGPQAGTAPKQLQHILQYENMRAVAVGSGMTRQPGNDRRCSTSSAHPYPYACGFVLPWLILPHCSLYYKHRNRTQLKLVPTEVCKPALPSRRLQHAIAATRTNACQGTAAAHPCGCVLPWLTLLPPGQAGRQHPATLFIVL